MDRSTLQRYAAVEDLLGRVSSPGSHPGLERIAVLMEELGSPLSFPAIHLAGTNGKGSTAAFLESMYRAGGYKTAMYTSPHLTHLGERLTVDGAFLAPEQWEAATELVAAAINGSSWLKDHRPTYFENLTAAAFVLAHSCKPDVAIIETGMGGRLDATNLLTQVLLPVITPIDWDHMDFLGSTLYDIAFEKFGILRSRRPALYSGGNPELEQQFCDACAEKQAEPHLLSHCSLVVKETSIEGSTFEFTSEQGIHRWQIGMVGTWQPQNAALALRATELLDKELPLTIEAKEKGLFEAEWAGRMEVIRRNPDMLIDGAHNPHGMRGLAQSLKALYGSQPLTVLFAAMGDKDYVGGLKALAADRPLRLICTEVPENERSEKASQIMEKTKQLPLLEPARAFSNPLDALACAESFDAPVILCGSLYFIGFMREELLVRHAALHL